MSDPTTPDSGDAVAPESPAPRPYELLYDGACAFCTHEARRLARWAGGRVHLDTLQRAFPDEQVPDEIKLRLPDGRMVGGAEAVVRALARSPMWCAIVWVYFAPGVRQLVNAGYRWVAARRYALASACPEGTCGMHARRLIAPDAPVLRDRDLSTYRRSAKVFWVLFGLLYAAVFASLYVQVLTLMGGDGLLPAAEALDAVRAGLPDEAPSAFARWAAFPTLFWWGCSDAVLRGGCVVGVVLGLLVAVGVLRRVCLLLLGVLYLSYVTAGTRFFYFQWDNLLLETTLHALLLPASGFGIGRLLRRRGGSASLRVPHGIAVFLMQWLLFRLYFESGIAKILPPGGGWRDLTAMQFYYDTAPLPTWIGWYASNLPQWWHRCETLLTLVIEIVLPVVIFARRRWRRLAFVVFTGVQLFMLLTANYGSFNYLSLFLGLFLLEDRDYEAALGVMRRLLRRGGAPRVRVYTPPLLRSMLHTSVLAPLAAAIVLASLVEFALLVVHAPGFRRDVQPLREVYSRCRLVNSYHLFASMTRERLVPQIEGQTEAGEWVRLRWRWVPDEVEERPPLLAPHHPRVDFQMWFVTLSRQPGRQAYFVQLLERLCANPRFAARVFEEDPFEGACPRALRVRLYRYEMTTPEEREETGAWWRRTFERVLIGRVACEAFTDSGR